MKDIQQKIIDLVGIDRLLHFAFGGWIACQWLVCVVIYQLKTYSEVNVFDSCSWWVQMLLVSLITGAAKDLIYDKWYKKSKFEWVDVLATQLGGMVGVLVILFVSQLIMYIL